MSLLEKRHVHCIGIGGIGVSALAKILHHKGISITGSDAEGSSITEELVARGMSVALGHQAENVPENTEAVIFSSAVQAQNPERAEAERRGIPTFTYAEALGEITRQYRTIAVSGTHGKSTTTALLGSILIEAGLDPLILVGTKVAAFSDGNAHLGAGEWFVVEACEHEAQMMKLKPEFIVITNLEPDHLDYYGTFERLQETFRTYVKKIPASQCIANVDDPEVMELFAGAREEPHTFGMTAGTLHCTSRETKNGLQVATLKDSRGGEHTLELRVPGVINVMNAMAAIEAARCAGVEINVAVRAAGKFPGSWRRFERVGEVNGAQVITDYGHHPTAIRETVQATREFFPGKRLVLVYQPHQHHRTAALYPEFVEALTKPDALILNEIYDVKGREREEDSEISSEKLLVDVQGKRDERQHQWYARSLDEVSQLIRTHALPDDVILVMGAGDIYKVAHDVCSK